MLEVISYNHNRPTQLESIWQHLVLASIYIHLMGRPRDPPRRFLPFGNPFRMILPKGSSLSPKMLDLLNTFEENLSVRLQKLKPTVSNDFLSFKWMTNAMKTLCEIHADIKRLVTALQLPICDWDDMWIEAYFDDSVKLLDISSTFYHEILRLKRGHLNLICELDSASPSHFLDVWEQHMGLKDSELDRIFPIMSSLAQTLELPKVKNSPKEKAVMQALYGLKAVTLFVCSVFAAAFFGSAEWLVDVRVAETCIWAEAFVDLQNCVNTEIRNGAGPLLKELKAVVEKLYNFEESMEKLYGGLNLLAKEVNGFFRVVLLGRNALLSNLRRVGEDEEDSVEDLKARVFGDGYNKI